MSFFVTTWVVASAWWLLKFYVTGWRGRVCDKKVTIFCQTKRIFVGRSSATVKKICEVGRKMGLFGPDSVPPNQLQFYTCCALNGLKPPKGV
jgi:hypothetical protein